MKIRVFIPGEPYCQNKTKGNVRGRKVWSQATIEATQNLPRITSECKAEIGLALRLNEYATAAFPPVERIQTLLTFLLTNFRALKVTKKHHKGRNIAKLNTQKDSELLLFTLCYNTPVSFNQGVTGSRPVRPTRNSPAPLPTFCQRTAAKR